MKRKYILSGLLACALTFSACDVDLLDIPQKGVENEENYYQTDEQCESAIAAVYASWRNAYSGRGEKASQYANGFFLKNFLADDFNSGGARSDQVYAQEIYESAIVATNGWVENYYKRLYATIYLANLVIERFDAAESEVKARNIAEVYIEQGREKLLDDTKSKLTLDGLFSQIQAGNIKELNLIVKADVQGSVEAVKQSLLKLSNDEVAVRIIHAAVGAINESDVSLASASNAIIIGFNVRPDNTAKEIADREKVDVRLYRVIYNAIEDIEAAMKGMLDPEYEEKVIGHAEVRQTFKASGVGMIAGSYVLDGTIQRDSSARIIRDGIVVHEGKLASIQRGKDAVKEVRTGFECGLVMENFNDIKEGDQIESFIMEEVPR